MFGFIISHKRKKEKKENKLLIKIRFGTVLFLNYYYTAVG